MTQSQNVQSLTTHTIPLSGKNPALILWWRPSNVQWLQSDCLGWHETSWLCNGFNQTAWDGMNILIAPCTKSLSGLLMMNRAMLVCILPRKSAKPTTIECPQWAPQCKLFDAHGHSCDHLSQLTPCALTLIPTSFVASGSWWNDSSKFSAWHWHACAHASP